MASIHQTSRICHSTLFDWASLQWASSACPSHRATSGTFFPRVGAVAVLAGCVFLMGGCPSSEVAFDSPAPLQRALAIAEADPATDDEAYAGLIGALASEEPVERLIAINRLETFTGERFGYRYEAGPDERAAAVQRWRVWYEGQQP
jgi:hypothetical protein